MNKKVFIACDSNNVNFVKKIIKDSQNKYLDIGYKFGLEFFYSKKGRAFISKIKSKNIFLDLKLNDIPNTCMAAINSLKDLKNIRYLTVHVNGGLDMMRKIKINAKKINKKIKVIGVTVLTSFSNKSIREIGFNKSIINLVSDQAKLAKAAGLDGIVCSGHEANYIRDICKKMEIIIPGIRLVGDNIQDQKRVMTPKKAFENGATALVIGRSITKGNIKKNIQKLIKSLK